MHEQQYLLLNMVKWSICAQSMTAACRGKRKIIWKIVSFLPLTSTYQFHLNWLSVAEQPNIDSKSNACVLIRKHKSRYKRVRALKTRMYLFEVFLSGWKKSIQQQLLIKFSTSELMYQNHLCYLTQSFSFCDFCIIYYSVLIIVWFL